MKIGIIGGSIAGLAIGRLLQKQHEVTILERSEHSLIGRGAGIFLPKQIIQLCIDCQLFDDSIPSVPVSGRSFLTKQQKILSQPIMGHGLHWRDIYRQLRQHFPDDRYLAGRTVASISQNEEGCDVVTTEGEKYHFDYVIGADGLHSFVRKSGFTDFKEEYAGYCAWRGTITQSNIPNSEFLNEHIPYYMFDRGHVLLYRVPSENYAQDGSTLINWVFYEKIDHAQIEYAHSIPPGGLTPSQIQHLNELAQKHLPPHIADIVLNTPSPFLQSIFDTPVINPLNQRLCLVGDAAATLRPHSASGTLKALLDAMSLAKVFALGSDKIKEALTEWSLKQTIMLHEQVTLSQSMGSALVLNTPDWETLTEETAEQWWQCVMTGKSWYAQPTEGTSGSTLTFQKDNHQDRALTSPTPSALQEETNDKPIKIGIK